MNRTLDTTGEALTVNRFARSTRHMKTFSRAHVLKMHAIDILKSLSTPFNRVLKTPTFKNAGRFLNSVKKVVVERLPVSPQKRLLFQAIVVSISAILVTSITPGATFTAASMTYSNEYMSSYAVPGDILISDESGYLVKINPQTDSSNRVGLTDYAVHTVESGESLSVIAEKYGVSTETVAWENGIANGNRIRIGQKLMIPPVDGIGHKIQSGDTLEKLATKYNISVEAIIAQNGLEDDVLTKGQALFLPGAKPIYPVANVAGDYRVGTASRTTRTDYASSSSTPAVGKIFIYPTKGKITQGFHSGHYALDIADRSMPPIWAGAGGTVIKASSGTWGGGYGNHVIIDHGNGVQSLYAHMDSLNVYEGQYVNQGDVIGVMGNTGRVYGATGIHLHWEVTVNGVKKNPGNYY